MARAEIDLDAYLGRTGAAPLLAPSAEGLANLQQATAGLPEATDNLNRTLRRLDFLLLEQQGDLDRSVHDLRVILSDFREFMATGKEYPSWAVFGDPPAPKAPEEKP